MKIESKDQKRGSTDDDVIYDLDSETTVPGARNEGNKREREKVEGAIYENPWWWHLEPEGFERMSKSFDSILSLSLSHSLLFHHLFW